MSQCNPVSLAVAGLGGYAGNIIQLVLDDGPDVELPVCLTAVCDPAPDRHADLVEKLTQRGVSIYPSYEAMLQHPGLEAVWLPVPIDLHVPFATAALERGLGVMVEKPVAGTVDEVDRLIAARNAADRPVLVGFQDVYDTAMLPLKQRILAGEIGQVRSATVHASSPRPRSYFDRAGWAGALRYRDQWVLDSPVNNALAHFVNVPLFLLGPTPQDSAAPQHLEAELYRAARIENYDTASIRVTVESGATLLLLFTHASDQVIRPVVEIIGDRGRALWSFDQAGIEEAGRDLPQRDPHARRNMLQTFAREVRGLPNPERLSATLEVARAHTVVVNGASEVAPITPVPEAVVDELPYEGSTVRAIRGIPDALSRCARDRQMLHESGLLPFTVPPRTMSLQGYRHFTGPAPAAAVGSA